MRRGHFTKSIIAFSLTFIVSLSAFGSYKAVDKMFSEAEQDIYARVIAPGTIKTAKITDEFIPGTPEPGLTEATPDVGVSEEPVTEERHYTDEELDVLAKAIADAIIAQSEENTIQVEEPVIEEAAVEEPEYSIDRTTEDLMYELSNTYMDAGYIYDIAPFDLTDDEEYNTFKANVVPQLGQPARTAEWNAYIDVDADLIGTDYESLLINYIDCVDHRLLNRMFADGWRIHLTGVINDDTYEESEFTATAGITLLDRNIIEINYKYIEGSTIHEIGHVLAERYGLLNNVVKAGYVSYDSKGLDNVYCHNAENSPYANLNLREKLADLFEDYFFTPREFEAQAPELYQIYTDSINSL